MDKLKCTKAMHCTLRNNTKMCALRLVEVVFVHVSRWSALRILLKEEDNFISEHRQPSVLLTVIV